MNGLRTQYQDRLNFVILDYDLPADLALAKELGVARHPAYAVIPPDGGPSDVEQRLFGPQNRPALTALVEELVGPEPPSS